MAYGQDGAWGLQATKTLNGASWNGQTSPYLIASGYATNIFKGDPVIINNAGYITSLWDWAAAGAGNGEGANDYGSKSIIGVFNGCSYTTSTASNPVDPASPGRPYWPGGTATLNELPAIAFIIDDPDVIFNVQVNENALTQADMGKNIKVVFDATGTQVNGNTSTGVSLLTVDQATIAVTATHSCRLLRLVADSRNTSGLNYNNAEVLIQNHAYCTRPATFA